MGFVFNGVAQPSGGSLSTSFHRNQHKKLIQHSNRNNKKPVQQLNHNNREFLKSIGLSLKHG